MSDWLNDEYIWDIITDELEIKEDSESFSAFETRFKDFIKETDSMVDGMIDLFIETLKQEIADGEL